MGVGENEAVLLVSCLFLPVTQLLVLASHEEVVKIITLELISVFCSAFGIHLFYLRSSGGSN